MRRLVCFTLFAGLGAVALAQNAFQEFLSFERRWDDFSSLPPDYDVPGEFVVGRLMFPQVRSAPNVMGAGGGKVSLTPWANQRSASKSPSLSEVIPSRRQRPSASRWIEWSLT